MGTWLLAEDEGFEPPQTESESGVLPLHKSSKLGTLLIILAFRKMSSIILQNYEILLKQGSEGWNRLAFWREAPMPPLEGEVVERQQNRRGLYVNMGTTKIRTTPSLRLAKSRLRRLLACIAPAGVSVSPFGLPALPEGEPRALCAAIHSGYLPGLKLSFRLTLRLNTR